MVFCLLSVLYYLLSLLLGELVSPLLARLKEFESPTFRLGGGRSILLSYKRIYNYLTSLPQPKKFVNPNIWGLQILWKGSILYTYILCFVKESASYE